jgi:hypothetical protein
MKTSGSVARRWLIGRGDLWVELIQMYGIYVTYCIALDPVVTVTVQHQLERSRWPTTDSGCMHRCITIVQMALKLKESHFQYWQAKRAHDRDVEQQEIEAQVPMPGPLCGTQCFPPPPSLSLIPLPLPFLLLRPPPSPHLKIHAAAPFAFYLARARVVRV